MLNIRPKSGSALRLTDERRADALLPAGGPRYGLGHGWRDRLDDAAAPPFPGSACAAARDRHREARAAERAFANIDASAGAFENRAHERKTDARAVRLRETPLAETEHPLAFVRWNAGPVVVDGDRL